MEARGDVQRNEADLFAGFLVVYPRHVDEPVLKFTDDVVAR